MFAPGLWPAYAREAHGCEVTDLDGRRFIDMTTSGIGSCLLGYADPDVTAAVQRRIALGSMSTLNAAEEVELAELLIELHPWAEQVRYSRSGGESMAIAVRIARAATGRDKIAFCGYHGWSDWYLAANVNPAGATDTLQGHLMAAIIGRRRVMEAAQTSFISSTYWTEAVGPTAALATIRKLREVNIAAHTSRIGGLMRDGWKHLGQRWGVPVKLSGHPTLLHLSFDHEQAAALGTLVTARMLDRGFLAGSGFYPSYAHKEHHITRYLAALEPVFTELAEAVRLGDVRQRLHRKRFQRMKGDHE